MTLADDIAGDVEEMHDDWSRADVLYYDRALVSIDGVSSTPTFSEDAAVAITGVLTTIDEKIQATIFGGLTDVDAVLMVTPAELADKGVTIDHEDCIGYGADKYRVEEVRPDEVRGTVVEYYYRLVKL